MKNKTYKLGMYERITLPLVLPDKGTIEKAIICDDIREKIKITQEDLKRVKLRTLPNGNVVWNDKKDKKIEIKFTELELEVIKNGYEKLDSEGKFSTEANFVKMYRMFNEV